jgi:hypothetical protein
VVIIGFHVSVVDRLCGLDLGVKGSKVCGCLYQFSYQAQVLLVAVKDFQGQCD